MLACELEPEAALHRRDQLDSGVALEDSLDECRVGEVVLDVEDHAPRACAAAERGQRLLVRTGLVLTVRPLSGCELDGELGAETLKRLVKLCQLVRLNPDARWARLRSL